MLVISRILFGMILGVVLILVSEVCLANHEDKEHIADKLTITHKVIPIYKFNDEVALVGSYRRYEDSEVEADRVFVGLKTRF